MLIEDLRLGIFERDVRRILTLRALRGTKEGVYGLKVFSWGAHRPEEQVLNVNYQHRLFTEVRGGFDRKGDWTMDGRRWNVGGNRRCTQRTQMVGFVENGGLGRVVTRRCGTIGDRTERRLNR